MEELLKFVQQNIQADTTRLMLDRGKWPEFDMDIVVNCIESRNKLKGKVKEWFDNPDLIFPLKLSAEQCSSSLTGLYKADLAAKIVRTSTDGKWKLADLTGGLGVDSWFFSKKAEAVLYCEMQKPLCDAAKHNFAALGAHNIEVRNCMVAHKLSGSGEPDTQEAGTARQNRLPKADFNGRLETSPEELFAQYTPEIIYLDPARRGEGGRKVFLLEDCTPDILTLKDSLFMQCRHILLKLSPMADITMVCERLGSCCREVHVVGASGECKELLVWMDREWKGDYTITAAELSGSEDENKCESAVLSFSPSEERSSVPLIAGKDEAATAAYLFEPGKALMKAGAYNLLSARYGLKKLGRSTHYYIASEKESLESLRKLGKVFSILRCESLDKRSIKDFASTYPKAEVTARNLQMDTDTLRKKLGTKSSDKFHIFGLKSDTAGNLLLATERQ